MRTTILLCVFTLLLLVGCRTPGTQDYFPLAQGNTWTYTDSTVMVWHGMIETTLVTVDSSSATISEAATIQGRAGWKVINRSDTFLNESYVVRAGDSVLTYSSLADTEPTLGLKLPLAENSSWVMATDPHTGRTIATVKTKEKITVPAGTFADCWRLEITNDSTPGSVLHSWFAPDVGQVRMYTSYSYGSGSDSTRLTMDVKLKHYSVR